MSAEGKLPEDPKPVADAEEVLSKVATTLAEAAISATNDSRRRQKWILAGVAVMVFVVAAVVGVWLSWPLPPPRVVGSKQITNDGLYKYWPVTDGNRVYITEFLAGSNVIAQVSSAGGETAEINVPLSSPPFLSDVSSDGSELLLGTGGVLRRSLVVDAVTCGDASPLRKRDWAPCCVGPGRKAVFCKVR